MERHGIDEQHAFHLLRDHARIDVAASVLESPALLSTGVPSPASSDQGATTRPTSR